MKVVRHVETNRSYTNYRPSKEANCLECLCLTLYFMISENISADLKGPNSRYKLYKLHYGSFLYVTGSCSFSNLH